MKPKDIKNRIKDEGRNLVPRVLENIYAEIDDSLSEAELLKIEKKLNAEKNSFVPTIKEEILNACEINENPIIENELQDEKSLFVPISKDFLKRKIPSRRLVGIFKNTNIIALSSACLIAIITTAIVLPNILKTNEVKPINSSNASLEIISASNAYNPELIYTINNEGNINEEKIVPLNDESSTILNNISSLNNEVTTFVNDYLTSALKVGCIERQDVNKENYINLQFITTTSDYPYYANVKKQIEKQTKDFTYKNKIVAKIKCEIQIDNHDDINQELLTLIREAYELSTKLFTDENGNCNTVLCFSSDYNDWIEKYKNYPIEEMRKYVDFLLTVQELITNDEDKKRFIDELEKCEKYKEAINDLSAKYDFIKNIYDTIFNSLKESNNQLFYSLPRLEDEHWDWWADYGKDHKPPMNKTNRPEIKTPLDDYDDFVSKYNSFDFTYDLNDNKNILINKLNNITELTRKLVAICGDLKHEVISLFDMVMSKVGNGDFMHDGYDYPTYYEETPPDWNEQFDNWWDNNKH